MDNELITYLLLSIDVTFDADPENKIGSPIPKWLMILKEKYNSQKDEHGNDLVNTSLPMPLGKLSVFLSFCLDGTISCSSEETQALQEVSFLYEHLFH